MAKTFYTEQDIEDLAGRGVSSLVVDEGVVLTDLAREKAERLGVALVREDDRPPSAPQRPYLAVQVPKSSSPAPAPGKAELQDRVRKAVIARLGSEVDSHLLDTIIRRVVENLD